MKSFCKWPKAATRMSSTLRWMATAGRSCAPSASIPIRNNWWDLKPNLRLAKGQKPRFGKFTTVPARLRTSIQANEEAPLRQRSSMNKLACVLIPQILFFFNISAQSNQLTRSTLEPDAAQAATALLAKARDAMGFGHVAGRVLHSKAITASEQNYQSDRTYPPFFANMNDDEIWFDAENGILRVQSQGIFPGGGPLPISTNIDDGINAEVIRGDRRIPIARRQATSRY